ncbi:MAG: OBG GTPase family GTP-binding protein [Nanoarchaeota archaeon]
MAAARGEKRSNSISDQIKEIENEIANTKYNKKTQHHVGLLKAKIAQLREKQENRVKASSGAGHGYSVRKTGDGTVVLLGFPSVGKSTLLNVLTNQDSEVGAYAFTTLSVIPGMMEYKHAKIQILDVPGIVEGAAAGTGRGKEVLQVIRNADLILRLIDVFAPEHYAIINREADAVGVRLNQTLSDVKIVKTDKGGIDIGSTVELTKLDAETIEDILKSFKIINAQVVFREDIDAQQLIDVILKNCVYIPAVTVVNKIDLATKEQIEAARKMVRPDLMISAHEKTHIDELRDLIFDRLDLMRLYLKEVGKKADMEEPLIISRNADLGRLCEKLHKDFVEKFRFARIWGDSAKFDGQRIRKLHHVLKDEDVVEIHLK